MLGVRGLGVHIAVGAACAALAVAFTWPLPLQFRTHLLGDPAGDMGAYVWNQWAFRTELIDHGHNPFRTDLLFAPGADVPLGLHNYTVLADLLSVPLQTTLGLVATFNLIHWVMSAANAYAMFLLARYLTGDAVAAFLAALSFGFSPFLLTRATAHESLAMAAALPTFLLLTLKARDSRRYRHAVGAGLALAAAALCDAYYGMYGLMMGAWVVGGAILVLVPRERRVAGETVGLRIAEILATVAAVVVTWIVFTGGGEATFAGHHLAARTLYTPVLVLTLALAVRVILASRRRPSLRPGVDWKRGTCLVAAALAATVAACAPVLREIASSFVGGSYVEPSVEWRTGPPGADLLALLLPNPNHALWSWGWLETLPNGYVENVASQSVVALGAIAIAWITDRRALPGYWCAFAGTFTLLTLGPFIRIAGANTYVPAPWALLRYLPVLGNARSPTRFAMLATLGVAVLFAFAVKSLRLRSLRPRPWVSLTVITAALLFELQPAAWRLFDAKVPSIYAVIARDPRTVTVLELPFGVRSGAWSVGDFSAFSMFCQTAHGKRLLGGYLSRVPEAAIDVVRARAMTEALLQFSAGKTPTPVVVQEARAVRKEFLRHTRLGYVVVDTHRASERMQRFAANALHLEPIGTDGKFDLYAATSTKAD